MTDGRNNYEVHFVKDDLKLLEAAVHDLGNAGSRIVSVTWTPEKPNSKEPQNPFAPKFVIIVEAPSA